MSNKDALDALERFLAGVRDHASATTVAIEGSGYTESALTLGDLRQLLAALRVMPPRAESRQWNPPPPKPGARS